MVTAFSLNVCPVQDWYPWTASRLLPWFLMQTFFYRGLVSLTVSHTFSYASFFCQTGFVNCLPPSSISHATSLLCETAFVKNQPHTSPVSHATSLLFETYHQLPAIHFYSRPWHYFENWNSCPVYLTKWSFSYYPNMGNTSDNSCSTLSLSSYKLVTSQMDWKCHIKPSVNNCKYLYVCVYVCW